MGKRISSEPIVLNLPADENLMLVIRLTAAVAKGNICATQFHPEKSGDVGLDILKNFIGGGDAA